MCVEFSLAYGNTETAVGEGLAPPGIMLWVKHGTWGHGSSSYSHELDLSTSVFKESKTFCQI